MTRMTRCSEKDAPHRTGACRDSPPLPPALYVVSTPIGNLGDITRRAVETLARADLILAEDTRVTRKLLSSLGLKGRLVAFHDHSGPEVVQAALDAIAAGQAAALVSDAGTPLVSDPGHTLVAAVIAAGHQVTPIPGPSALIAALSASGLPATRFLFEGFLPAKTMARRAVLAQAAQTPATLIFFESGHRLAASLLDMCAVLGNRACVVARELTKLYEEFRRGDLEGLAAYYADAPVPKGEIVVLVGPPSNERAPPDPAALDDALREALARGGVKDAARSVAARFGLSARELYTRAQALKDAPSLSQGAAPGSGVGDP